MSMMDDDEFELEFVQDLLHQIVQIRTHSFS